MTLIDQFSRNKFPCHLGAQSETLVSHCSNIHGHRDGWSVGGRREEVSLRAQNCFSYKSDSWEGWWGQSLTSQPPRPAASSWDLHKASLTGIHVCAELQRLGPCFADSELTLASNAEVSVLSALPMRGSSAPFGGIASLLVV